MATGGSRKARNGGGMDGRRCEQGSRLRLIAFSLLPTLVLFGTIEAGLRFAGFEFHGVPTHLRFGPNLQADMERDLLVPDPDLFWRLRPGGDAPAGRPAVVALGDSCSFFGRPAWPDALESLLAGREPGGAVQNAAVPGYSSHQGRRLFEREIAPLRPAWLVVYFGWNDHWLGLEKTDRSVAAERPAALAGAVPVLEGLRIVQAGRALRARLATPPAERRHLRVPPEEYRENLAAICGAAGEAGTRVALVTAPADLDGEDAARLAAGGYAAPGTDVPAQHERYNDIVREVAAACGATLVDFAADAPRGAVGADGIHLTPAGTAWLASRLAQAI